MTDSRLERATPAMHDDRLLPFDVPAVCRKKVTAAFDGGSISSDGGLVLLREAERRLGLSALLAKCIRDRRDPARITHQLDEILQFRMFAIASGYEDADVLSMAGKLGARYGTADEQGVTYVRDPKGVFGLSTVTAAFEPDAKLPESAVDTGYGRDGIKLHIDPADTTAVWLSYPDGHVELWPLADLPIC